MKKRLLLLCSGLFSFFAFESAIAQEYEHLEITSGLNEDVIANGTNTASASTTELVDDDSFAFVAVDFQPTGTSTPPSYGLPVDGLIASGFTDGLSFQLADYSANNSLRIHGTNPTPAVTTGTLVFQNQVNAKKLYVLATSGSGQSTVSAVINFTDASSQTVTGLLLPDWYFSDAQPIAASGFGRVNVNTDDLENPTDNPRLYQILLEVDVENQLKDIESIAFTKTSTATGVANIFAVTAELVGACPSPEPLSATSGISSGTVTWNEPAVVPANGYDYYYSTSVDEPTETTVPTGNTVETSVVLSDLGIGETYYFWVRANCGDDETGTWVMTTFTTGQISVTYTDGVINTLYNSFPSVTSTTTCPGIMTVTIPDGYQIADVATSYTMTTAGNGYMSEQRSLLVCTTTNTSESSISSGTGSEGGTLEYNRTGLSFANGATGDVEFELRAWRTFGGSSCNSFYNFVENNSWTVTVTYECITPDTPDAIDQTVCTGSTVSDLIATMNYEDAILNWYDVEDGGIPLAEEEVITSGTYYVSQKRYTCESERQAVIITVTSDEPTTPTTEIEQSLCTDAIIADLYVESAMGTVVNWYATADSEDVLDNNTMLATGSYFVSQSYGSCESDRVEVNVTINVAPDNPMANANQSFCEGSLISDLMVEPSDDFVVNWYATADSEGVLGNDTVLVSGSYFVSQSNGDCESDRTEVNVTVNEAPDAPTVSIDQSFCGEALISDLMVEPIDDFVVNWYATADSEVVLGNDTMLASGSYFVSQFNGDCESERVEVAVTVNVTPVPAAAGIQSVCGEGTIADLIADPVEGATLNWYATADSEETLGAETVLETGSYFVSESLEGCESDRVEVSVTVNVIPNAPTGDAAQNFDAGETVATLEITTEDGAVTNWYVMDGEELVAIDATAELVDGETYYVSQTVAGCESEPLAITVSENLSTASFSIADLKVYPNPANNIVTIAGKQVIESIELSNMLGQKVLSQKVNADNAQVDVSALSAGTYILNVYGTNGVAASVKLVKKN